MNREKSRKQNAQPFNRATDSSNIYKYSRISRVVGVECSMLMLHSSFELYFF